MFDLYDVANHYLGRILDQKSGKKEDRIRVLLLDDTTSSIISMVATQSELLKHEFYLVDKLGNANRDRLRNLPCICLLEPSELVVANLCDEMGSPNYKSYDIYFNNVVSKARLEKLAESDDAEVVDKVAEIFMDYYTVNRPLFNCASISNPLGIDVLDTWDPESLDVALQSLTSLLLALKLNPDVRYESNSKMAAKLANMVNLTIRENANLFDQTTKKDIAPLLLIMDRKNDPITPLLFPWTYQSMIHEVIGIRNNTVDLSDVPNVGSELQTVVLNETQDEFYGELMYKNFGMLSESLKKYIDKYKSKTKTNSNISSIKDMKFFLENYPEFKKTSLNLSKHMLLTTEIDRKINELRMWEVSEFEQNMVSSSDMSKHQEELQELEQLLFDQKVGSDGAPLAALAQDTKLKILALYAIKYESFKGNQIAKLLRRLKKERFPEEKLQFVSSLLKYAASSKRLPEEEDSVFSRVANSTLINGLNFGSHGEPSNVYMQHIPRLQNVLMRLAKGRLGTAHYPFAGAASNEVTPTGEKVPPQEIVIFMVGGVTYEEARLVAELNKGNSGLRVVIGGTHIPNSEGFVENLQDVGGTWGAR